MSNSTLAGDVLTGTLTAANDTVYIATDPFSSVGVSLTGTFSATVIFEASPDGTNWQAISALTPNGLYFGPNASAPGQYVIPTAGFISIRARASAYTSGTVNVTLVGTYGNAPYAPLVAFWNDYNGALTANQVLTGTTRDVLFGNSLGSGQFTIFKAQVYCNQAVTVTVQFSNDGTTWYRAVADSAIAANGANYITSPVTARYYRVIVTNGATAATTCIVNTAFASA